MFDNLSERLERSFKILKGEGKITEINVDNEQVIAEVRARVNAKMKEYPLFAY